MYADIRLSLADIHIVTPSGCPSNSLLISGNLVKNIFPNLMLPSFNFSTKNQLTKSSNCFRVIFVYIAEYFYNHLLHFC